MRIPRITANDDAGDDVVEGLASQLACFLLDMLAVIDGRWSRFPMGHLGWSHSRYQSNVHSQFLFCFVK